MGDFNAKVGSDNSDYEYVMGHHGLGEMSENGELLAEFGGNNDIVIGGSLFPHRPVHKVTWVSRDGLTDQIKSTTSASAENGEGASLWIHRQEEKIGRRFNTRRLEDAAVRRSFVEELENQAAEGGSVEDQWTAIKNAFIATGENNLGELRTQRKQWITDDSWMKIEERRDAKAAIERAKTRGAKAAARQRYTALEKEVKRSCKRDKRAWTESLDDEELDDLADRISAAGIKINVNKTKSLDINTVNPSNFTVAGQAVENVESFQYLGSQMASDGGTKIDIGARIKKARAAFASYRNIWKNNQISRRTKTRIFNSNVKSVLLYASETWCVSVENTQRLQVFINRCLRYIIRAWWPHNWISNAELHRRCHQKPIATEIRERKWRWVGHTLRRGGNEICKQALDWNPAGHRSRGRPTGSWWRSLSKEIKEVDESLTWQQVKAMAGNRPGWRSFTTALCTTRGAQEEK
ncbi:uncharacterized protein LOC131679564 [Topomyia yanbarensis]|uniref:uncharacterized protein LOC131679564 n=1 Tax=Topomyia yanbarensis TaxID=2498891 RepID=UPI00273C229B|nr:uncharacterized protein LOC131679564 [Topomyia yanbarensis]